MDFITNLLGSIIAAPFICVGWIIVGIAAGALARRIMGASNRPFWNDWLLGIIGSFVGGFLVSIFGIAKPDGGLSLVIANLVIATIGAAALIAVGRAIRGGK